MLYLYSFINLVSLLVYEIAINSENNFDYSSTLNPSGIVNDALSILLLFHD